ncbi:MAG: hypothetical protein [Microviridae sp.]|nr:MAG: hypothetical protein [Microviridae sp.]
MRYKMNEIFDKKTGEVKSFPRCVHSMDFGIQALRLNLELSKRVNDDYIVHTEDYENINDMVRRCTITKTKLKIDNNPAATYDTDEDIAAQLPEYAANEQIDQSSTAGKEPEQEQAAAKRSDGKASSNSGSTASETML